MAAFRLLNQFPVYFDQQGRLADGGELRFYESGTTTPKDVYGDQALTVNNGSSVAIGSDGRTVVDVWGDGEYRVRLYDADGTLIGEADNVEVAGGTGQSIPALVTGQFLTNNGALLLWAPIREMPDPTGQDGKYPVASGSGYVLQSPPEPPVIPEPDWTVGTTTLQLGEFLIQTGTATAPSSGARTTSTNVAFPTAYTSILHLSVTPNVSSVGAYGIGATMAATGYVHGSASTGFTATFNSADDGGDSGFTVDNPVPFTWVAFGLAPAA